MKNVSSYIVSALISLYPQSFKKELGEDMKQVMLQRLQESTHKTKDVFSFLKEGCVAIPKSHIHAMKKMQEYYEIEKGVLVKKYRRVKKKGPPLAFYVMFFVLGGIISLAMFGRAWGASGQGGLLMSLFVFLFACLFYRTRVKYGDSLFFGGMGFFIVHLVMFVFFTNTLQREAIQGFVNYPKIKDIASLPQYDKDGNLIETRFWRDGKVRYELLNKDIWCERHEVAMGMYNAQILEEAGSYRKGIDALLGQSILSQAWAEGCMTDEAYIKKHTQMAKTVWETNPWFSYRAMDYTPLYQLLEISDYIIAPRLFLSPMKICPVLFYRAYPNLKESKATDSVGSLYCAEKYRFLDNAFFDETSYFNIEQPWVYGLGLGRKSMDEAKQQILSYKGMSMDEFNAVYQDIKNDHKTIGKMVKQAQKEFQEKQKSPKK